MADTLLSNQAGDASSADLRGRLRSVGAYTAYTAFFVVALAFSLVWTFPTRQLKVFVQGQARRAGLPLAIGELELRGIGGVTFKDVRVTLPAPKRKPRRGRRDGPAPPAPEPTVLRLDELRANIGVLGAIGGTYDVDFELSSGEGTLEGGHLLARRGSRALDLEIENIDALPLGKLGIGKRILAAAPKLSGELDGNLGGRLKLHWGGTPADLRGRIDLELVDAVIKKPALELQGGLHLADLRMGVLTLKVRIDKKRRIKVLSGRKGSDKATAISLEGVDTFGPDIELVVEERSHVLIPPGKAGMRAASLWVHFAFALPHPKDAGGADAGDGRLKWSDVMKFAGNKLKPFERNGYVGMTCSGALRRPHCKPALPQVTVGTRRKARSDARKARKAGGDRAGKPAAGPDAGSTAAGKQADKKGTDNKSAEEKGADSKSADKKGADSKSADKKGADKKGADNKSADNKSADNKSAEEKSADKKNEAEGSGKPAGSGGVPKPNRAGAKPLPRPGAADRAIEPRRPGAGKSRGGGDDEELEQDEDLPDEELRDRGDEAHRGRDLERGDEGDDEARDKPRGGRARSRKAPVQVRKARRHADDEEPPEESETE